MAVDEGEGYGRLAHAVEVLTEEVRTLKPLIVEHALTRQSVSGLRDELQSAHQKLAKLEAMRNFIAGAMVAAGTGGGIIGAWFGKIFGGGGGT